MKEREEGREVGIWERGGCTDRCRVKKVGWRKERRTGRPSRSESKTEERPLLLPVIRVLLFKCQRPSVFVSLYKKQEQTHVNTGQRVTVVFISINLEQRENSEPRMFNRFCINLSVWIQPYSVERERERERESFHYLCWCTQNKVNYFSDLLRKLKEIFQS